MGKKTIIYISGQGFIGSTLLDILLGAKKDAFSAGELIFFPQKGIKNQEYCSCGKKVPECEVWSNIYKEWEKKRNLKLDEYIEIQRYLTSLKKIISSIVKLVIPRKKINYFIDDTYELYNAIFSVTNSNIIIDSSKSPLNILILKKNNFDLHVVHLVRRFGDILNSNKKRAEKNLKKGIEHEIVPNSTSYVFLNWVIKNLITIGFSRGVRYKRIKYEDIVATPEEQISYILNNKFDYKKILNRRGPFYPKHLVAGNKIRMEDEIFISEKPMHTEYHRLNGKEKLFARLIDQFY
ncbi:hypothetical protein [Fodinibius saliphilus]|uniref:hypothetical protein n=1 Tax=Fodinibius saliphilus TaxID=1920650 RepID=UPI0011089B93|nr:hypothetical protein [Fodinibius saliphilus]